MKMLRIYGTALMAMLFLWACEAEVAPDNTDVANEIEGVWRCERNDGQFTEEYDVTIKKIGTGKIQIDNFHNFSEPATVIVYEDNTLQLERQTISGTSFEGAGKVASSFQSMTLDYTATDTEGTINVTTSYSLGTISKKVQ